MAEAWVQPSCSPTVRRYFAPELPEAQLPGAFPDRTSTGQGEEQHPSGSRRMSPEYVTVLISLGIVTVSKSVRGDQRVDVRSGRSAPFLIVQVQGLAMLHVDGAI